MSLVAICGTILLTTKMIYLCVLLPRVIMDMSQQVVVITKFSPILKAEGGGGETKDGWERHNIIHIHNNVLWK